MDKEVYVPAGQVATATYLLFLTEWLLSLNEERITLLNRWRSRLYPLESMKAFAEAGEAAQEWIAESMEYRSERAFVNKLLPETLREDLTRAGLEARERIARGEQK